VGIKYIPRMAYRRQPSIPPSYYPPPLYDLHTTEVPTPYGAGTHNVHSN